MNKKMLMTLIIAISSIFIMPSTFNANASNLLLDKEQVIKNIEKNENKIKRLEKEFEGIDSKISLKERELVDILKESEAKKKVLSYNNSIDGLKLFEIVLKSDNMSELMSNIKMAKKVMLINNQAVIDINKKEEIARSEHTELNKKQRELETKILQSKEDRDNLIKKKKKIEHDINNELKIKKSVMPKVEILSVRKGEITFNPNNITEISNTTVNDIYKVLKGTNLYELAPVYMEAERLYGVNAFFMIGLCAQESAWGTSYRAVHDNNLTGFGVYSDSSTGLNSETKRDNILRTASWIKRQYLTKTGLYYNGLSIKDVNTRYCIGKDGKADYHWSDNITSIARSLVNKL